MVPGRHDLSARDAERGPYQRSLRRALHAGARKILRRRVLPSGDRQSVSRIDARLRLVRPVCYRRRGEPGRDDRGAGGRGVGAVRSLRGRRAGESGLQPDARRGRAAAAAPDRLDKRVSVRDPGGGDGDPAGARDPEGLAHTHSVGKTDIQPMSHALTLITFIPLAGAAIILLVPRGQESIVKWIAAATTVPQVLIAIGLYQGFDTGTTALQFVEKYPWISSYNINYF